MVSQAHIARLSGFSRQTVSFALNDRLRARLNPKTCQRVLDTADRLGYVPHHAARRLVRARYGKPQGQLDQVGLICLVEPDNELDGVGIAMMSGAEHELAKLNTCLTFIRVGTDEDWSKVDRFTQGGSMDAWLIYGPADDEIARRLKRTKLPFVILGDHRCTVPIHFVSFDNAAAGRLAVEHLAAMGHRRIGFFSGGKRDAQGRYFVYEQETFTGFRAAVHDLGLDDDERLVSRGALWGRYDHTRSLWSAQNAPLLRDWLDQTGALPTAIVTAEIEWADTLCRALRQLKIEVPSQISIVGFEPPSNAATAQDFSRIDLPVKQVGREGAMLLRRIVAREDHKPHEIRLVPQFIQGWSTTSPSRLTSRATEE